jgi:uncharacterized protein YdiU (UPF0061 family)
MPPAEAAPPSPLPGGWRLEHSYAELPALFYEAWSLTPVAAPSLLLVNRALAESLGLDADALEQPEAARLFAGCVPPPGAKPLAQAYAGHQFGSFTGLGDGRALLLGEQVTPAGQRFDIQLKGSGRTPFSRGGDGRAAVGPMLREYVISEAMHALGIPTTRSLAVAATGEVVMRREGRLPGAVLTRVAASHIRVGTFEWAAAHQDPEALAALARYTLARHYPQSEPAPNAARVLLEQVSARQAALVARWLAVGFVHGVLNTDNVALSGETIDYGPCAFLDAYHPDTTFSSIDRLQRYAYGKQATITHWNLARLAEALLPILDPDENAALDWANATLGAFPAQFESEWLRLFGAKLGLFQPTPADRSLIQSLLEWMQEQQADFTNTFCLLSTEAALTTSPLADEGFVSWHRDWVERLRLQPESDRQVVERMRVHNPMVIPRNHRVEEALTAAVSDRDLEPLRRLLNVLASPYDHAHPPPEAFTAPAPPSERPYRTFCGT